MTDECIDALREYFINEVHTDYRFLESRSDIECLVGDNGFWIRNIERNPFMYRKDLIKHIYAIKDILDKFDSKSGDSKLGNFIDTEA